MRNSVTARAWPRRCTPERLHRLALPRAAASVTASFAGAFCDLVQTRRIGGRMSVCRLHAFRRRHAKSGALLRFALARTGAASGGLGDLRHRRARQTEYFLFRRRGRRRLEEPECRAQLDPADQHLPAAAIGALAVAPSNDNVSMPARGRSRRATTSSRALASSARSMAASIGPIAGLKNTRYIGDIWVDPKHPDVVLVGAQGHFFGPSSARGVFRSTDGGKNWSHVLKINDWTGIVGLAADPNNPEADLRLGLGGAPISLAQLFLAGLRSRQRRLQIHRWRRSPGRGSRAAAGPPAPSAALASPLRIPKPARGLCHRGLRKIGRAVSLRRRRHPLEAREQG